MFGIRVFALSVEAEGYAKGDVQIFWKVWNRSSEALVLQA